MTVDSLMVAQRKFLAMDVTRWSQALQRHGSDYWQKMGEKRALRLFHRVAREIPAYRDFLRKHGVDHAKIKTARDFRGVPPVDKKNYLRAYPLQDLVFPKESRRHYIFSASSGSTGKPFLWPRGATQELEGALIHELIFSEIFGIPKDTPTLCAVTFSMGTWIAGTYTLASIKGLSEKGYRITSVTPGIDTETAIDVLKTLLRGFRYVILAGYPPYVKDVLDEGARNGILWKKHRMKFLLAGEGISEGLRDYLVEEGGARDALRDVVSLYGTADAAILGHETPLTIFLRRHIAEHSSFREELFSDRRLPSFFQYHPEMKFFETMGRELLFTANAGIPLIRYRIGDAGGIFTFDEIVRHFNDSAPGIFQAFPSRKGFLWRLPFLYLYGRSDLSASLYAVLIYPENIKTALESRGLKRALTGKFVMATEYGPARNQYLHIRVELKSGQRVTTSIRRVAQRKIVEALLEQNMEYRKLYQSLGEKVTPLVTLIPYADPNYFASGNKQQWVRKP